MPAEAYPVEAYLSGDEVVLVMSDDTSRRAPVPDLPAPNRYEVMGAVQPFWDAWNANKAQMKALGFHAIKQNRKWYLRWCANPTADTVSS